MASLMPGTKIKQLDVDYYRLEYTTPANLKKYILIRGQDLHAMEKQQLGEIIAG
jgi:hypothetical protein